MVPDFAEKADSPAATGAFRISPLAAFRIAEHCRHRTVHDRGEIEFQKLSKFGLQEKKLVNSMVGTTLKGERSVLLPTSYHVELLLERLASLGEIAFRTVSSFCRMSLAGRAESLKVGNERKRS